MTKQAVVLARSVLIITKQAVVLARLVLIIRKQAVVLPRSVLIMTKQALVLARSVLIMKEQTISTASALTSATFVAALSRVYASPARKVAKVSHLVDSPSAMRWSYIPKTLSS